MTYITNMFTTTLAVLTVFGFVLSGVYLVSFAVRTKRWAQVFHRFTARHIPILGLVITAVALLSTLVFSEVVGYEPCELCWYQRIMLYPQVVLFIILAAQKTKALDVVPIILLSTLGALVALVHIYTQFAHQAVICDVTRVTCDTVYFLKFGFISMPVMSLSLFSLLIVASLCAMRLRSS